MPTVLSVHDRWHSAPIATAPQMLTCAYCVLLRWEHDNLAAPYWRWYCNEQPGAWLVTEDRRIPIEPGRVLLIPPNTVVGTGCEGRVGHLFMHFALGLDRVIAPGRIFEHKATAPERSMIRTLIGKLDQEAQPGTLDVSFLAHALVSTALALIPPDYWEGRLADRLVSQALQSIGHGARAKSNAELAKEAGMNTNAFARKFNQAVGYPPQQYGLQLRIGHGCRLLAEGTRPIDQIAVDTGFCDRFHFSKAFKRVMGVSPATFRKEMKYVAH
jgi:AraC-like DNA-binding protein